MNNSNQLHELIHSLTKSELKSFAIQHASAENKISTLLFDYVRKQKVYDEKKLKQHFKGYAFTKQLTSAKYYLYTNILKSLNRISTNTTNEGIILTYLQSIKTLNSKKLYHHSLELIRRAYKRANAFELHLLAYECLSWEEITINYTWESNNTLQRLEAISTEKKLLVHKIENLSRYQNMRAKIFSIIRNERFSKSDLAKHKFGNELKSLIKHHPPQCSRSYYNKHYALGIYYFHQSNFQLCFNEFKSLFELLNDNKYFTTEQDGLNYLNIAQNTLVAAIHLKHYDEFVETLLEDLKNKYRNDIQNYLVVLRLELAILIKTFQFDEAVGLVNENQKMIGRLDSQEYYIVADFLFGAAQAFFWKREYSKAIKWINKITLHQHKNFPKDIYFYTRLIEIITHIELQNEDLVVSSIKSLLRLNEKEYGSFKLEEQILVYLLRYVTIRQQKKQRSILDQLNVLTEDKKYRTAYKNLLNYFDLSYWLKIKTATLIPGAQ